MQNICFSPSAISLYLTSLEKRLHSPDFCATINITELFKKALASAAREASLSGISNTQIVERMEEKMSGLQIGIVAALVVVVVVLFLLRKKK
jgi:hypothetical protein